MSRWFHVRKKLNHERVISIFLTAARLNENPVAVVKPLQQEVQLPNDVVIEGSGSTDDDKIVTYHWEPATGPLDANALKESQLEKSMLVLHNLTPGSYTFKYDHRSLCTCECCFSSRLTVTDSDGATNSTFAHVTVVKGELGSLRFHHWKISSL